MHSTVLPYDQRNLSIFMGGPCDSGSASASLFTWMKPADAAFVYVLIMSSGGAGCNGTVQPSGASPGGYQSMGGGASPVWAALYPTHMVPDILYATVRSQVPSVGSSNQGISGLYLDHGRTKIFAAVTGGSEPTVVSTSGTPVPTAGPVGSVVSQGSSGSGYMYSGNHSVVIPAAVTLSTTGTLIETITGNGSPGGIINQTPAYKDQRGYDVTTTSTPLPISTYYFAPTIKGGQSNTVPTGGGGTFSMKPFFSTGGAGGYSRRSPGVEGTSGPGGVGGPGSGGGGAGGTVSPNPAPSGGVGGPGLIIIKTF